MENFAQIKMFRKNNKKKYNNVKNTTKHTFLCEFSIENKKVWEISAFQFAFK